MSATRPWLSIVGIGVTLARRFPPEEMTVLPQPGAFSLAAAKLLWPLARCATLTVHGRPLDRILLHLVPGARLLLLDEPTEGLAPVIIQQIGNTIRALKAQGFTILLVEQNFRFASTVADRYYVIEHGKVVDRLANSELDAKLASLHEYLGV